MEVGCWRGWRQMKRLEMGAEVGDGGCILERLDVDEEVGNVCRGGRWRLDVGEVGGR